MIRINFLLLLLVMACALGVITSQHQARKRFMREQSTADKLPRGLPVRAKDIPPAPLSIVGKAVKAGDEEVKRTPRARSAVLRVAEKAA